MHKHIMKILAFTNICLNLTSFICIFVFPPAPYALIGFSLLSATTITLIQIFKRKLLIDKMTIQSMIVFGFLICLDVFYLILSLVMLVYLQQVQLGEKRINHSLSALMWQGKELNFTQVSVFNLVFYIGNCVTLSFYTRQYYQMFWVNNIVHIYRYLKQKVHYLNETLLAHLPTIQVTKQLKQANCCLCLQNYHQDQTLTKVSCGHIFHKYCIRIWVVRSNACPLCRKRVVFY